MARQTARDLLVTGLRNAHAMEIQARELMERQSDRTDEFPEVKQRLKRHLEETRQQLTRLEDCLRRCDENTSSLKDTASSTVANLTAMAHSMAGDEILKNTFANNAFEHYEIAAYKSLLAICERADIDVSGPLAASLREEEEMAAWIDGHVREVTLQYLSRQERAAA